jgi:hypothetical protein
MAARTAWSRAAWLGPASTPLSIGEKTVENVELISPNQSIPKSQVSSVNRASP